MKLQDEAEKIFLCAEGTENDVSEDMMAFLRYLTTRKATTELTKRIDEEVEHVKAHEEWRLEYMTLFMRDKENQQIGREEQLMELIQKKLDKDKTIEVIADELEMSVEEIIRLIDSLKKDR